MPVEGYNAAGQIEDDQPVPGTPAQQVVSDLTDVLHAAPDLKVAPGLALSVAKYGGNVTENAQQVAGVAKSRSIETGTARLAGDVGPDARVLGPAVFGGGGPPPVPPAKPPGGIEGFFDSVGSGAMSDLRTYRHDAAAAAVGVKNWAGSLPSAAGNLGESIGHTLNEGFGTPSPGETAMARAQTTAAAQGQGETGQMLAAFGAGAKNAGSNVMSQTNAIFTMPSHTFRYLYDIRARHGNAAMFEAAVPLIGGGFGAAILTHDPGAGEETEAGIAEALGDSTEPAPEEAPEEPTGPQKVGQAAKGVTKAVLKPVVAVGKGVSGAVNAVATSPVALGVEAGAMLGGNLPQNPVTRPDSWQRTANATTWRLPDGRIGPTFGQDVAGAVGLKPGAESYNALSGVLDAFMYVAAPDPLGAAGRVVGKYKSAEGLGDSYLGRAIGGGTAPMTPSAVDAAVQQYPQVKLAMKDIAGIDSPGAIAEKYPLFAPVSVRLSKAKTVDEVKDVFKDLARTQELTTTSALPELGPYQAAKSAGRSVTGIFTPAPTTFDDELQKFVGKTMDIGSSTAVPAIGQLLTAAGEDHQVVQQVMDTLASTGDPRMRIEITKNAFKVYVGNEILKALPKSSPQDFKAAVIDSMNSAVDNLFGGEGAGHTGQFGRDKAGGDLSTVYTDPTDPEAGTRAAAIWFNQADRFKIPSQREIKATVLDLAQMQDWTAKNAVLSRGLSFEQFIDSTVNEKIFQPLALATMGWATRVSISEAAMNVLRLGPLNFTAARIASSAATQNWKLDSEALGHFSAVVHGVLAGVDESAVRALGKERILDAATSSIAMFNGHVVSPALDATHAPLMRGTDQPEIAASDARAHLRRSGVMPGAYKVKNVPLSDDYTILAPGGTGYMRSLSEYAGRIANDKLGREVAGTFKAAIDAGMNENDASALAVRQAQRFLDDMPENEISHMTRHFARSQDSTLSPHGDWAVQSVAALKGTIYGKDGTLHRSLLDDIVNNSVPDVKGMIAQYGHLDGAKMPQSVPGREVQLKTSDLLQRASNSLHSHVLGPVVNALSREPTWVVDYATERKLLEGNVKRGELTQDQADVIAATRAAYKSIRFVHNPLDRLKIENMLHTFAPFYFAQNQAIRRAGRLFAANPGAFEQYLKLMLKANSVSHQVTLKNGTPTVIIPGTTIVGEGITGALGKLGVSPVGSIPIGLTGGADVSTTINPFSSADTDLSGPGSSIESALKPSFGPVAAIPLKAIASLFDSRSPTIANIANKMLGPISASEPLWEQFVPNSILQHTAQGVAGGLTQGQDTFGSSYTSVLMSVMASMAEAGGLPKGSSLTGALNSDADPAAEANFIKQANNVTFILWMGRTIASGAAPVTVSLGQAGLQFSTLAQDYINKAHGNIDVGLDNMTKAHPNLVPSEVFKSTSTGGYAFPETAKAETWITENQSLVTKYPTASRWLMPQQDATGSFSDQAYNMELAHGLRDKLTPEQFFDQIYVSSGDAYYFDTVAPAIKAAIAQRPGDSEWAYQVYQKADADLQTYGTTINPIWYKNWTSDGAANLKRAAVAQMKQMLADPSTPKSQLATHLGYLVNIYQQFQGEKTNGNLTTAQQKAQWGALMNEATTRWPDTKQVIQSVFLGLG